MPLVKEPTRTPRRKAQRQPRQSRGEQRVTAILEACERLLVEEGEAALGMHRIAAEAETSIGSLYHFFPNKQSMLLALSERHELAIQAVAEEIGRIDDATWQAASAERLITLLVKPLLDYVAQNPVLLSLIRFDRAAGKSPTDTPVQPLLQALCIRILTLRLPGTDERARKAYAATLLGLPLGLVTDLMVDYDKDMRAAVLHEEIPRALTAYIQAIEASQGRHAP